MVVVLEKPWAGYYYDILNYLEVKNEISIPLYCGKYLMTVAEDFRKEF